MASCASSWQLILYMCACVCARVCVLPFGSYRRLIYIAVTSTCPQHATIWLTSFGRMLNWLNWYCCYYCCCCYISIDLASTCCCFCWPNKNCDYFFCLMFLWCCRHINRLKLQSAQEWCCVLGWTIVVRNVRVH